MMSGVQPVNELEAEKNSKAFTIMVVPDQMADSFLCQHRQQPEKVSVLKPGDAKWLYYLSSSRLHLARRNHPLLLLMKKEKDHWKVIAWAVEVP
jgi:hypothetical protein